MNFDRDCLQLEAQCVRFRDLTSQHAEQLHPNSRWSWKSPGGAQFTTESEMRSRQAKLDFQRFEQVIQYEISRFSFADDLKKQELRKIYRDLEADFRNSVRSLSDLEDLERPSSKAISLTLESIERRLRQTSERYRTTMGEDLKAEVESCCSVLAELSQPEKTDLKQITEICNGFDHLKRSLSVIHRM